MLTLQKDVIFNIIKHLDYKSVQQLCLSQNNKLYKFCKDYEDVIWNYLLERDYLIDPTTVEKGTAKKAYLYLALGHQVWSFGYNYDGQLGFGDKINRFIPTKIEGFNNIIQIACGDYHSLMIDNTGQVWSFGYNNFGQLGLSDDTIRKIPTKIKGFNNIIQIACGEIHSLMIDNAGQVNIAAGEKFSVLTFGK